MVWFVDEYLLWTLHSKIFHAILTDASYSWCNVCQIHRVYRQALFIGDSDTDQLICGMWQEYCKVSDFCFINFLTCCLLSESKTAHVYFIICVACRGLIWTWLINIFCTLVVHILVSLVFFPIFYPPTLMFSLCSWNRWASGNSCRSCCGKG